MKIKINKISEMGLPETIEMRRRMRTLMPELTRAFLPATLHSSGPMPFAHALDTVVWFMYGEKPVKF